MWKARSFRFKHSSRYKVRRLKHFQLESGRVSKSVGKAEEVKVTRADLEEDLWERTPNLTIIRVSAPAHIAKEAVEETITEWLDENGGGKEAWELTGASLARNFTIRFRGQRGLAARRCRKALDSLRREDGAWQAFQVETPTNSKIQIYLGEDKNSKQVAEEKALKRLMAAFKATNPAKTVFAVRKDETISMDWVPIAKVSSSNKETHTISWNATAVTSSGIDKLAITQKNDEAAPTAAAEVEWCF